MTHAFDIKRGETSVFLWKNNSSLIMSSLSRLYVNVKHVTPGMGQILNTETQFEQTW